MLMQSWYQGAKDIMHQVGDQTIFRLSYACGWVNDDGLWLDTRFIFDIA
jgi:hypothetical protein